MGSQSIKLPNDGVAPALAAASGFTSAATLLTVPTTAKPWAKFVCRHEGTSGFWYGCYAGVTPTTISYDFKLGPNEPHNMDNPPKGAIKLLASGSGIGNLSYGANWRT